MTLQPNEKEYIYTDGIDYKKTSNGSIWGTEEESTKTLLKKTKLTGKWLNLCAGDGRFNNLLLSKADTVIAADIDKSALKKLVRVTPKNLVDKLKIRVVNVVDHFPFSDQSFNGIFCVGTLHLFPEPVLEKIFQEMDRILKPGGLIIIDYAADIKRELPSGKLWVVKNEPNTTIEHAEDFLREVFCDYTIDILIDKSEPEEVILTDRQYVFSCQFVLLKARKKQ
jgi:ubiquinone/menaquinone biosynthesis C-methylase UbiE